MTLQQLEQCRVEARKLWLSGWWLLNSDRCLTECNGIGALWMGFLCKLLNFLMPSFVTASAIHDMRYFLNEGDRHHWDDEFETNCRAVLRDRYGRCNTVRYVGYWLARRLRVALTIGGEIAWDNAGKRFTEEAP